jgi:hypothetical protein
MHEPSFEEKVTSAVANLIYLAEQEDREAELGAALLRFGSTLLLDARLAKETRNSNV